MSRIVDQFDPSTETSTTFNAGFSNGTGRIVVYNQSPNNLNISWDAFQTYCPAWTAMLYCITSSSVKLNWAVQSTLVNAVSPPISQVTIEAFNDNETIMGTYPASLMHQINVGNNVGTTVTATNAISNTTNAPLSNWLAVQPNDALAATFSGDTSGNFSVSSDNAGVLTTLLQLIAGASPAVKIGAAALIAEVLGGLKIDGTLESVGNAKLDGTLAVTGSSSLDNGAITTSGAGDLTLVTQGKSLKLKNTAGTAVPILQIDNTNSLNLFNSATGVQLNMKDQNGVNMAAFSNQQSLAASVDGASSITVSKVFFNIGALKDTTNGTIAASGTVNHGCSGTPNAILMCPDSGSSTWTFGASSYTSTQFTATLNSALTTKWVALR